MKSLYLILPMLILGILSSALALWGEALIINSVVETGDVDVEFDGFLVVEGDEFGKAWVADCVANLVELEDEDLGNPSGDDDLDLSIVVVNSYPGYSCTIYFNVRNTGSVPVTGPFYEVTEVPSGIRVVFEPRISQLHPGDIASYTIYLEVLQEAEQGIEYEVQVHLRYIQWNEAEVEMATISGYAFNDMNGNGNWDLGENPLGGVSVELHDDQGNLVSTYSTGSDGYYEFAVYPLGTKDYTVVAYTLPSYEFTTPSTIFVTVSPGSSSTDNNFGLRQLPELYVSKVFRDTETDFELCPAKLGGLLDRIEVEVPDTGLHSGEIVSVSPGAFYSVIQISGEGITWMEIRDEYDFHFDVNDGREGKVRLYLLDSRGCTKELTSYSYTVNNVDNVVTVSIDLDRALNYGETILVYLKFKPTDEFVGSLWNDLEDKHFDNIVYIETDIGNKNVSASIEIVRK